MCHGGHCDKAECIACSDRSSTCAGAILKAAHVGAGHTSDTGVGLVVLGLTNGGPFCGFGRAVDDELGEAVYRKSQPDEQNDVRLLQA